MFFGNYIAIVNLYFTLQRNYFNTLLPTTEAIASSAS